MAPINAEFQILFHPDLPYDPKEVVLLYTLNQGKSFEDYLANKLTVKNWQITIYDLPMEVPFEFFLRILLKDGRIMLGKKENQNWKIGLKDNTNSGMYKAQVRIAEENLISVGRRCLVCDQIIPKDKNICQTPNCAASFCPTCNRMLPPNSNYCPWDKKSFAVG
jgi:hypothetical protein